VFFFYVGRELNVVDFGTLNLAISFTYILGVTFLDLGLNLSTVQILVAGDGATSRAAGAVFLFKILLFLPLIAVIAGASMLFGLHLPAFSILFPAALFTFFVAVLEYLSSVTNAFHRMELEAFLKIANRILVVVLGLSALMFKSLPALLWAMSLAATICCVVAWIVVDRTCTSLNFRWDPALVRRAIVLGLPIAGTLIVSTIYMKWDLIVLTSFSIGREQIGWYAAAFKIVEAFSSVPGILGAALFPTMVQLRLQNPPQLERLLRITIKLVLLFSIPTAAIISELSGPLIGFIYGPQYLPASHVLSILIWCIVPVFLYFFLIFVNIAGGDAKYNLLAGIAAIVGGIITNLILIPRIGYVGAAWAALVANASFAFLAAWKVCDAFPEARIPGIFAKMFVAGLVMLGVSLVVPGSAPLRLISALFAYGMAVLTLRSITGEDMSLFARILRFTSPIPESAHS
jgi:O-antigen/teichoic acid export membrane protein